MQAAFGSAGAVTCRLNHGGYLRFGLDRIRRPALVVDHLIRVFIPRERLGDRVESDLPS